MRNGQAGCVIRPELMRHSKWGAARSQCVQSSPQLRKAAKARPAVPTPESFSRWREPARRSYAPSPPANKMRVPASFQSRTKSPSGTECRFARCPAAGRHVTSAACAATCIFALARECRIARLFYSLALLTHESGCKNMAGTSCPPPLTIKLLRPSESVIPEMTLLAHPLQETPRTLAPAGSPAPLYWISAVLLVDSKFR